MSAIAGTEIAVRLPEGWVALPTHPDGVTLEWAHDALPAWTLDSDHDKLRAAAAQLIAGMESPGHPHRKRYALLTAAKPVGFRAVLQTDISAVDTADAELALEAAQSAPAQPATFRREVLADPIGDTPTVAVHELVVNGTADDPSRLQEIFSLVMFPAATGIAFHLTLTSPDLAAFDDIVALGREIAGATTVTLSTVQAGHD